MQDQQDKGESSRTAAAGHDDDTDTKLALLASLLDPMTFPIDTYLEALASSGGDVGKAAEGILLPKVNASGKRKAGSSLEGWLGKRKGKEVKRQPPEEAVDSTAPVIAVAASVKNEVVFEPPKPSLPKVDLMSVLGKPPTTFAPPKTKSGPQPPILLPSQAAISAHDLPLTLCPQPLPPALASALYLTMMEESESWEANKFYIAGRAMKSPHTTSLYMREGGGYGGAEYYYSGSVQDPAKAYPPLLRRAAELVEAIVNTELEKRQRYPLEWAGEWRANVCGANRYDGAKSSVGWHADQLTYLGPYTTIASLSLGTPRAFRLRPTNTIDPAYAATPEKAIRTYEVTLGHNSLCLMNGGCQERFKHTVPTQKALDQFRPGYDLEERPIPSSEQKSYTSRINITFRFYRKGEQHVPTSVDDTHLITGTPDFHPNPGTGPLGPREGTPICKCGVPTVLRADQKAKARSRLAPTKARIESDANVLDDDMLFFWQCQSPAQTGDDKGCGFFRILDMKKEGRGPCVHEGGR
ncbi:hypothetical protein IAT38_000870 [Cryptococcus sp. DSM 104549]